MRPEDVLTVLKQATAPVSGESLSKSLGVSRTAIWKCIESLREQGYNISSAPRRGYELVSSPDILSKAELASGLDTKVVGTSLICLPTIDSTNTECKRRMTQDGTEGLVIISDEQTGGRGRRGHGFLSPKGKGLYLSAVLQPNLPPFDVVNLTCWTAVAVCRAIEQTCPSLSAQIKWTNDIIVNGKKVCGILTEMELEAEDGSLRYVIPGIGINCNHSLSDFPEELHPVASSLAMESGRPVHRATLAKHLIKELDRMYEAFPQEKESYLGEYRDRCVTLNRNVQLIRPNCPPTDGYAIAIDDDFSLVVRLSDNTLQTVTSGEVSVRGLCGYI